MRPRWVAHVRSCLAAFVRRRRPEAGPACPGAGGRSERGLRAHGRGRRAERAAAKALRRLGWRVLARNVRTPGGEVDVLALDGGTVVLVEVKATARTGPGRPLDRVDHRKRERLRAAWAWLAASKGLSGRPHRFDVVEVATGPGERRCEVRRGAFRG